MEKYCDSQLERCGSKSICLSKSNNSNLNIKKGSVMVRYKNVGVAARFEIGLDEVLVLTSQ